MLKSRPYFKAGSISIILVLFSLVNRAITSPSDDRDLILTTEQKEALEKFKETMTPILKQDYMKKDIFLIRWLRAKDFDVDEATNLLKENLKWRKENDIDSIQDQDWSFFELEYPILTDVTDRDGRPTMVANFGEWNIRRASVSGQREKLVLWFVKGLDKLEKQVRDLQDEGKNITRYNALFNLDKFATQSICVACLPFYTELAKVIELDYPNYFSKMWFINSPSVFNVVINLVTPLLSSGNREALKLYGTSKAELDSTVFQEFDRDQVPLRFGGSRADHQLN